MTEPLPKLTRHLDNYEEPYWTFEAKGHKFVLDKVRRWTGRGNQYRSSWYLKTDDGDFENGERSWSSGGATKADRESLIVHALSQVEPEPERSATQRQLDDLLAAKRELEAREAETARREQARVKLHRVGPSEYRTDDEAWTVAKDTGDPAGLWFYMDAAGSHVNYYPTKAATVAALRARLRR
jgi:hypothetical protein